MKKKIIGFSSLFLLLATVMYAKWVTLNEVGGSGGEFCVMTTSSTYFLRGSGSMDIGEGDVTQVNYIPPAGYVYVDTWYTGDNYYFKIKPRK